MFSLSFAEDKTGTLTCNVMDFRKFCVRGVTYGQARGPFLPQTAGQVPGAGTPGRGTLEDAITQLRSGALFPVYWKGFPLNSTNQKTDVFFSSGHWASETILGLQGRSVACKEMEPLSSRQRCPWLQTTRI